MGAKPASRKDGNRGRMSERLSLGIDVSRDALDLCTAAGESWRCADDQDAIAALLERWRGLPIERRVLEATGG